MRLCRHEWYGDGCPICEPMEWCYQCDRLKPENGFEQHAGVGDRVCGDCYTSLCQSCGKKLPDGVEETCDECVDL